MQDQLPITLCPKCGGHEIRRHDDVVQCHDCGHVVAHILVAVERKQ